MTLRYRTHQNFEVKMNLKNSKLVRTLKDISPRLKWAMFSKLQDCKIASRYIDYLIPEQKEINKDNEKLEQMVRDTLIKEFSPKIKESPNFHLLVDAVAHKLKKNSLKA